MAISVEARTEIISLVVGMFGAAPGASVLSSLVASYESGSTISQIAANLSATAEFKSIYPTFLTNGEFATKVVANLLAEASVEAKAEAVAVLSAALNGGMTRSTAMVEAIKFVGATATDNAVFGTSAAAFDNKVAVAIYYSVDTQQSGNSLQALQDVILNVNSTAASVTTAKAAIDGTANEGTTFTFTTAADTFTGTSSDDTFNAGPGVVINPAGGAQVVIDTLQSADVVTGGAGNDTLNVRVSATTAIVPVVTGVENVNATFNAIGELSLASSTGVTAVGVNNSTTSGTITSIGGASLSIANQTQNVNVKGSTATALSLNLDTVGTSATDITVDLGAGTANKATSFAITAKDAHVTFTETTASAATTTATIAATGSNELTFAAADLASLTSVTVTGAGSVDLSGGALTKASTLTVADGGVTFSNGDSTATSFSATTGAGKDSLTLDGANIKTVDTGAGNDSVTTSTAALVATASITLGAGDDTLTLHATPAAAGFTAAGGDGTDTLAALTATYEAITAYGSTDLAKITGFEVLSITDAIANGKSLDLSKLSGLTSFQTVGVAAAGTATVSNVGANAAIIMKGALAANTGALVVSLKDATGTADAVNLTLNGTFTENNDATSDTAAITSTVTATGIETVNVTSTGTASTKFLGATGNKADTVTNTLTLTNNDITTLKVSGDQVLSFTSAAGMTKLATVDASAATGGTTINVANASVAVTVTGSSGVDTVTGSAKDDVISGGAGNDVLSGGAGKDTISGGDGNDTITGGAGADTLSGGAGNDIFVLTVATDSTLVNLDTISDFSANTVGQGTNGAATTAGAVAAAASRNGDVIDLSYSAQTVLEFSVQSNAADAQTFIQNAFADAGAASVNVALDSSSGRLYIDSDNNGTIDAVILLTGVTTLTTAAFVV